MKPEFLNEILNKIRLVKIGIVGDFCLDAYWFVDKSRSEISVETGRPTEPVKRQKYTLGGAGNVAANLAAMETGEIIAFGVIGNDPFGAEMISIMAKSGINTSNMLVQKDDWSTHVYIKPHIGDTEQSRIDFGNFNSLSEETADMLIENIRKGLGEVDLVIINQQVINGIHTDYFRKKLAEIIKEHPAKAFIVDSRNYSDDFVGAYRKMNDTEAVKLNGILKDSDDKITHKELLHAAERLFEKFRKPLFITRGAKGSVLIDDKGISEINGLMIIGRTDTVGAGDSYLAGVAATLAAGYSLTSAGEVGTFAAGVTVQKLFQTGTATPEEILAIGTDPDYIYHTDLAEDLRKAEYLEKSEIEIINKWSDNISIKYAIFDNDGTISTLREGWEHIMAPMMTRAILGEKFVDADQVLYSKVREAVAELIDKTTGVQTLRQMKLLAGLVKDFGLVSDDKILDEHGYKQIYNRNLMNMVRAREDKLKSGELTVEDLTIKNAIPFLKTLYDKGVKLYLTSGTDEDDVKHEAAILGYDKLFEGRIFGAIGDLNKEAKKMVLERILSQFGSTEAACIVTFGDGPVEIRETCKKRGLTVGVASSELRRYGLNESKRTRLIKAGADIIIPDFSQSDSLYRLLKIK